MCCASFIVKYSLFFFNLVFVLVGIGLTVVGIVVLTQLTDIFDLLPVNLNAIPITVIVAGVVVFLIAFCGCCGAVQETRCLLILYAVFMIIIAAGMTYLTVVMRNNLDDIDATVSGWVDQAFKNSGQTPGGEFRALESFFRCCGTTGKESYAGLGWIPGTCCSSPDPNNQTCSPDATDFYPGCASRFSEYLSTYGGVTSIVLIITIVIELIAAIFALYLNHTITSRRGKVYY